MSKWNYCITVKISIKTENFVKKKDVLISNLKIKISLYSFVVGILISDDSLLFKPKETISFQ